MDKITLNKLAKKYPIINGMKVRYIKKKINSEGYPDERLNSINSEIKSWLSYHKEATTKVERNLCYTMLNMYLKRYEYYIKK